MPAIVRRPQWVRDQVRRERALARLTREATSLMRAEVNPAAAPGYLAELRYSLHHAGRDCLDAGCEREQIEQALDAGGLVDREREQAKAAEVARVSAGLPPDLQAILRGERCPSNG